MRRFWVILMILTVVFSFMNQSVLADGTYIVNKGDTLTSIAAQYGLTVNELANANNLLWNDWVYIGQTLILPETAQRIYTPATTSEASSTEEASSIKEVSSDEEIQGSGDYTVKPSDTLSSIARNFGTSLAAIQLANDISNPNLIYPGQKLIIPSGSGAMTAVSPASPALAIPASSQAATLGEKWIDVNLSTQTLTAYQGNTPVYRTLVSTGKSATPTVTGSFPIYVKYQAARMRGGYGADYYDLPNVPYVMYFYGGYGLHGTYWHNNFGTPMSHGCVNLSTPDAQWLYNWASIGTEVRTHY